MRRRRVFWEQGELPTRTRSHLVLCDLFGWVIAPLTRLDIAGIWIRAPPSTGVVTLEGNQKAFHMWAIYYYLLSTDGPESKTPGQRQVFPNQVLTTNRISEVANRNLHGFAPRYPKNWIGSQSKAAANVLQIMVNPSGTSLHPLPQPLHPSRLKSWFAHVS